MMLDSTGNHQAWGKENPPDKKGGMKAEEEYNMLVGSTPSGPLARILHE